MENVIPWLDGNVLVISADSVYDAPTEKVVPISEIFKLIAGHSNYHGDNILSALTCVSEGKIVEPIKPLEDVVEVVRCKNCKYQIHGICSHISGCNFTKSDSYCS